MVEMQEDKGRNIEGIIVMIAFGFMALIFTVGVTYLVYDFININEETGPGESTVEEVETTSMRISADRNSIFMVWRSDSSGDFGSFRGNYQGGENIDRFGDGRFSMVEISDNYYNNEIEESSRIVSTISPDISEISESVDIGLVEGTRVEEVNGSYNVNLLDGEQDIEVELELDEGKFRIDEIMYRDGEISGLEGEKEFRTVIEDDEIVGYNVLKLEETIVVEDKESIELKVEQTNSLQGMVLKFNDVLTKANTSGPREDPEGGLGPVELEVNFN